MLAAEIERAKQRAEIEAFDKAERIIAEGIDALCPAPDLLPGDPELLQPWLAFCKGAGIRHAPAKAWCVAAFVLDRHKQGVAEQHIFDTLAAITRLHDKFSLSSPVTGPVNMMLERLFEIKTPRSWPKADQALFNSLPAQIRARIATREEQRETDLRRRQNEYVAKLNALKTEAAVSAETEKEKAN